MIPHIKNNTYLYLAEGCEIPISEFNSAIVLSDLDIDNISTYCLLFANRIKAKTYHYMYDDQIEDEEYLAKFNAERLVFSYSNAPTILGKLTGVKEIILNGDPKQADMILPPNVTTQKISVPSDNYRGMRLFAPNVVIQDENRYKNMKFTEKDFIIGPNVRKITISGHKAHPSLIPSLFQMCEQLKVGLEYTHKNCWA